MLPLEQAAPNWVSTGNWYVLMAGWVSLTPETQGRWSLSLGCVSVKALAPSRCCRLPSVLLQHCPILALAPRQAAMRALLSADPDKSSKPTKTHSCKALESLGELLTVCRGNGSSTAIYSPWPTWTSCPLPPFPPAPFPSKAAPKLPNPHVQITPTPFPSIFSAKPLTSSSSCPGTPKVAF